MRVTSSLSTLQVNQPRILSDRLMKYAASNWTLVNKRRGGGVRWGGWGMGVERRHAQERSGIIHVNNIHLEYANTAYNTQSKHIWKALGTCKCGDKRATGHSEKLTRVHACAYSTFMKRIHSCTYRDCFVLHLIKSHLWVCLEPAA